MTKPVKIVNVLNGSKPFRGPKSKNYFQGQLIITNNEIIEQNQKIDLFIDYLLVMDLFDVSLQKSLDAM